MIKVRTYGQNGRTVVLLHGGPGAPGYMQPVARKLCDSFRVLEPLQRGGSDVPLTVARHIDDLHEVLTVHCPDERGTLIGHSWGAMLALAYAAEHPEKVASLVLVGCGTFDTDARAQMERTRKERTTAEMERELARTEREIRDPDKRLAAVGKLIGSMDDYDPLPPDDEGLPCDRKANHETWHDMLRLQSEGVYPAAFASIDNPAIMLHGTHDSHPGRMIFEGLKEQMPQLEYHEWEKCGHYPWRERRVRESFYSTLRAWLTAALHQ